MITIAPERVTRTADERRGSQDRELERLIRQSRLFAPLTRDVLMRAGLRPGMRVLDVGSGPGDVALIAADLVGPSGQVIGVDRSPDAVELAAARARWSETHNVRFVVADLHQAPPPWHYDAVVGRFVLMYQPELEAAVRRLTTYLRPGGILVLHELDLASGGDSMPAVPLWDRCLAIIRETFARAGLDTRTGLRLPALLEGSGLNDVRAQYAALLERGPDTEAFLALSETLRTVLPIAERFGVSSEHELAIDTLASRMREQALASNATVTSPVCVGAWGRKGGAGWV